MTCADRVYFGPNFKTWSALSSVDIEFVIRSGAEYRSTDGKIGDFDADDVELEKSNVLMMGPTGSGVAFGLPDFSFNPA